MPSSWEQALHKFIRPWQAREDVIGAVVTGSRAAGTATKNSDIDVHIILADSATTRERGDIMVDGFLIEYFVNPIRQLKEYQKDDWKEYKRADARMFLTGKILFDKTGAVKKLRTFAQAQFKKKFPQLSSIAIELTKYGLWDELDNLKDALDQKSPLVPFLYFRILEKTISIYAQFCGAELPAPSKLHRFFTDATFRKRYRIAAFPDKRFVKAALLCLGGVRIVRLKKLVEYTLGQMGGLTVDGWRIKSMVEV